MDTQFINNKGNKVGGGIMVEYGGEFSDQGAQRIIEGCTFRGCKVSTKRGWAGSAGR